MDPKSPHKATTELVSRRQVVKTVLIGGAVAAVMLPTKWTKPLVNAVVVPAHAQASAPPTTTTTTTLPVPG